MPRHSRGAPLFALLLVLAMAAPAAAVVRVGSKSFTENYVLAEIAAQAIEATGEPVERRLGLGGTGMTYRAVLHGGVDVYPEYTGTISRVILKDPSATSLDVLRARLRVQGLTISGPLGFDNTYALAVRDDVARRLGLRRISDLARHPELRAVFSSGFLERDDGWAGLRQHYGLRLSDVRVIEHALAYQALAAGAADLTDIFSTDGRLTRPGLTILRDDRRFFPDYSAVLLARLSFVERDPRAWTTLERTLVDHIDRSTMARLNALADLDGRSIRQVAASFLGREVSDADERARLLRELASLTVDHLLLVAAAVLSAIVVGVPLGILAVRRATVGHAELMAVGVLQTIPGLALLCFMIPFLGIGTLPALVALFLYALLPIVRGTATGLALVDRQLLEMADVLGLGGWRRLTWIELPLASVSVLAGIKTSTIWTVGTATLAAFIGGGGYGTLIVRGLALDDVRTILAGAVPAALMALLFHALFEVVDRWLVPPGLRTVMAR